MKKYADRKENLHYQKYETLKDVLKNSLLKTFVYEKAINSKKNI